MTTPHGPATMQTMASVAAPLSLAAVSPCALDIGAASPGLPTPGQSPPLLDPIECDASDRDARPCDRLTLCAAAYIHQLSVAGTDTCRRTTNRSQDSALTRVVQLLQDLVETGLVSGYVLVCAVSLVEKLARDKPASVNTVTCRHVLLACVVLASKCEDDEQFPLKFFADAGRVSVQHLYEKEAQLLERLSWNAGTQRAVFFATLQALSSTQPAPVPPTEQVA